LNFVYKKISGVDEFWSWSINKLCPGLRVSIWYNGSQPYGLAGYLNDFSSRMIGYATLRQLRLKNGELMFCNGIVYYRQTVEHFPVSSREEERFDKK